MTVLTWPKNPKIDDVVSVVNALESRLAALEDLVRAQGLMIAEQAKAVADHWTLREEIKARNAAGRLLDLEQRSEEAFASVAKNIRAIQAVFTLLHPDPAHPIVTDDLVPNGEWLHSLVMYWINEYGRLEPGEGAE